MTKQQVTRAAFLELLGLLALASQAYRRLGEIETTIGELLGLDNDYSQTALVTQFVFDEQPNAVDLLRQLGIKMPSMLAPASVREILADAKAELDARMNGVDAKTDGPRSGPVEVREEWADGFLIDDADAAPH